MAFHNTAIDGPMKQHTVITVINAKDDFSKAYAAHDKAVGEFNEKHNVFFNQIVPTIRLDNDRILVSTVCLYADKNFKK